MTQYTYQEIKPNIILLTSIKKRITRCSGSWEAIDTMWSFSCTQQWTPMYFTSEINDLEIIYNP